MDSLGFVETLLEGTPCSTTLSPELKLVNWRNRTLSKMKWKYLKTRLKTQKEGKARVFDESCKC